MCHDKLTFDKLEFILTTLPWPHPDSQRAFLTCLPGDHPALPPTLLEAPACLPCWFLLFSPHEGCSALDSVLGTLLVSGCADPCRDLTRFHGSKHHLQAHHFQNDTSSPATPWNSRLISNCLLVAQPSQLNVFKANS